MGLEDEDEIMEGLEELWKEGKIEHVPGIEDVDDPAFKLTDQGAEGARDLLRENDEAVLFLLDMHLDRAEKPKDPEYLLQHMIDLGEWLRDDSGVNLFRVLQKNPDAVPWFKVEDLPEDFIEVFDP